MVTYASCDATLARMFGLLSRFRTDSMASIQHYIGTQVDFPSLLYSFAACIGQRNNDDISGESLQETTLSLFLSEDTLPVRRPPISCPAIGIPSWMSPFQWK